MMISQGFTIANPTTPALPRYSPVQVINSSTGPDQVAFYYADTTKQALVTAGTTMTAPLTLDSKETFVANEVVVLSTADTTSYANPLSVDDAKIARFSACVVQIATISGTAPATVTFKTAAPWGTGSNAHCANPVPYATMMYKFVAHGWRIDTTRPDLAPLQLSNTGMLLATNTYTDQAYTFTDIQVATYFYDQGTAPADTPDPDTDGARDWYSSADQTLLTAPLALADAFVQPVHPIPLAMTISLVNHTSAGIEGITTAATPALTEVGNTANNPDRRPRRRGAAERDRSHVAGQPHLPVHHVPGRSSQPGSRAMNLGPCVAHSARSP